MWHEDVLAISDQPADALARVLVTYKVADSGDSPGQEVQDKRTEAGKELGKLARKHKENDYLQFLVALAYVKYLFEYSKAHKLLKKLVAKHSIPHLDLLYAYCLTQDFECAKAGKVLAPLLDSDEIDDWRYYALAGKAFSPNEVVFKKSLPGYEYLKKAAELCDDEGNRNSILFDLAEHASFYDEEDLETKARKSDTLRIFNDFVEYATALVDETPSHAWIWSAVARVQGTMGDSAKQAEAEAKFEAHCDSDDEGGASTRLNADVLLRADDLEALAEQLS